ncbi:hypothetical protein BU24DRAFT_115377 [Aaosphaeria arxii CBS 175.79]|uniref:EthD domain-containing protein n=1 Tax=Aaosphaeria arxii CBS 175.79 TaxID=1450172 RepID=A0A6A5Y179_9PLEO|nr:uncharacterized protein BU24DRAFT_115377 [Aaosphaeria arxii CBS 175.79]KAF2019248.1 hypothetical protein BU24DRAFT_115377 [Aaosphaeria arxii CBS 175.79]
MPKEEIVFVQLVSRKEGLTLQEFKRHQEEIFVPLVKRVCGDLFPVSWTRRYLAESEHEAQRKPGALGLPRLLVGRKEDVGWDCLGEMRFSDELHFQQFFALVNEKGPAEALLDEESRFSDVTKLKFIVMESTTDHSEYRSS